jgi:predicted nucleotidyltransferase
MIMTPQGLKKHTHAERTSIIERLFPFFQKKFSNNLIAIAATGSYTRDEDVSYSDLELTVFLKDKPPKREDQWLQRIVDGMLIEAVYTTEEEFLHKFCRVTEDWYVSGSEILLPNYNETFIKRLIDRCKSVQHPEEEFIKRAAGRFADVQESFGKVLNAIEQKNREGICLLLSDAVIHTLAVLSFLNHEPFKTFATFVTQGRAFEVKPRRFDELLDIMVTGGYQNLDHLQEVLLVVFEDFERMFVERGFKLYDDSIDPHIPNRFCD